MTSRPEGGATRTAGTPSSDRAVIKEPVWTPEIPLYFYTGGLAGASAGLALLSDLRGESAVARRAWATAFAGSVVSPALLISDLGVPRRFLNMLRLFKVTSPMSVGSWILAGFGAATAAATLQSFTGGRLHGPGRAAQFASALLGLPLASYTGALISNTSVPAWHHARGLLPFVFVSGAALSAGSIAVILAPVDEAQAARRLVLSGAVAELALAQLMEQRLDRAGVGAAYHEGSAARFGRAAKLLTAAGAAIVAGSARRSRVAAVAGGALATAGAIAERGAVFLAGSRSAARPQDTVAPQRARIDAGISSGASRRTARSVTPP